MLNMCVCGMQLFDAVNLLFVLLLERAPRVLLSKRFRDHGVSNQALHERSIAVIGFGLASILVYWSLMGVVTAHVHATATTTTEHRVRVVRLRRSCAELRNRCQND
jgi:hypothetical protein